MTAALLQVAARSLAAAITVTAKTFRHAHRAYTRPARTRMARAAWLANLERTRTPSPMGADIASLDERITT